MVTLYSFFYRATTIDVAFLSLSSVNRNEIDSVAVTTPPSSDSALNQPKVISIVLNDGSRLVATHKFTYRLDPRFINIEPRNHLIVYVYVYALTSIEKNNVYMRTLILHQ